ncbi:MAG TPA: hypothetical protein VGW38_00530 [Chloroflexota bacterium]|nr:hypothetical protein [Chloroflexota bacterium]
MNTTTDEGKTGPPLGSILQWWSSSVLPPGWVLCHGQPLSDFLQLAEQFERLGIEGDRLPDLSDRPSVYIIRVGGSAGDATV